MKFQPVTKTSLPKYAAAFACLSLAPMLTGCQIDGSKTTMPGLLPVSVESEPDVELGGDEPVYTEPEIILAGEAPIEPEPEPQEVPKTPETFAENCADAFREAFDRLGMRMRMFPNADTQSGIMEAEFDVCNLPVAFLYKNTQDDALAVCFYDGDAPLTYWNGQNEVDGTYAEMAAYLSGGRGNGFSWGIAEGTALYVSRICYNPCIAAFVDITRFDTLTADDAEQIIRDTLGDWHQPDEKEIQHETASTE